MHDQAIMPSRSAHHALHNCSGLGMSAPHDPREVIHNIEIYFKKRHSKSLCLLTSRRAWHLETLN